MRNFALIVYPPLAGAIVYYTGVKLLGNSNTVFIAIIAMVGAVGVGLFETLAP
jgi:hypothetical protein